MIIEIGIKCSFQLEIQYLKNESLEPNTFRAQFMPRPIIKDFLKIHMQYTRKNAQVVTNLQQTCSNAVLTTCHHDVFALLVTACSDNLVATC